MQSPACKKFLKILIIDDLGNVFNTKTNKPLKIVKKGFFYQNGKFYNLSKVMMYLFRKIPYENSNHIVFEDGNNRNFNLNNISYLIKEEKQPKPDLEALRIILNQLYGYQKKQLIKDFILYRISLSSLELQDNFLISWKDADKKQIVKDYINIPFKSLHQLSKDYNKAYADVRNIVYKYLNEIIQHYAGEMERLKSELNQKPKTLNEFNKIQRKKFALVLNRPKYTNENQ